MSKTKRIIVFFFVVAIILSFSITAYAANEEYFFCLSPDPLKHIHTYLGSSNTKIYVNDPATIKVTYTEATGYGYLLRLGIRIGSSTDCTQATVAYWYDSNNNLLHPSYLSGQAIYLQAYHIQGRVDNDLQPGYYLVEGVYNSDYTNP